MGFRMFNLKENYDISDLREIMAALRGENGCPWDIEQTHDSIRMSVLEEACEVMEAIDAGGAELLREELGDLLLQIVFHAQIEAEAGVFDFDGVCDGICKKLIYRHPHVFGEATVSGADEVLKNWDDLKSRAKGEQKPSERLESVPKLLPALMRAQKVGGRAANCGFDFTSLGQVLASLKSEIAELEALLPPEGEESAEDGKFSLINKNEAEIEEEFGDILFACCNLGRFLKKDSEKALTKATNKFIMRFRAVEALAEQQQKPIADFTEEELYDMWEKAKRSQNQGI